MANSFNRRSQRLVIVYLLGLSFLESQCITHCSKYACIWVTVSLELRRVLSSLKDQRRCPEVRFISPLRPCASDFLLTHLKIVVRDMKLFLTATDLTCLMEAMLGIRGDIQEIWLLLVIGGTVEKRLLIRAYQVISVKPLCWEQIFILSQVYI